MWGHPQMMSPYFRGGGHCVLKWAKNAFFVVLALFWAHIRDLHYKGLDLPSSIPLITQGFSSHPYMMKELRLPLDFSSTLFKIINLYYFISNIFYFKKEGWWGVKVVRLGQMRRTFTRMHKGTFAPNF